MAVSAKTIPSISVPFTDQQGRINPIWHEFLRTFVAASADGTIVNPGLAPQVVAGNGLVGGGPISSNIPLRVGQGPGIVVNADDVSVDISSQTYTQVALDDEVLISDVSDNNSIRKTKVRDIAVLGGIPGGSSTQVQYNNNGVFAADSGFTYDGAGGVSTTTSMQIIGAISIIGTAVTNIRFDGATGNSPRIVSDGAGGYSLYAELPAGWANNANVYFKSAVGPNPVLWNFDTNNTITMDNSSGTNTGVKFNGNMSLGRCLTTAIIASTTQTQGQGSLTKDYNDVTTVANANDTVTLPVAYASRYCLVKNSGANILKVFPATGDDLGNGVNASTTLNPGQLFCWFAVDNTNWYQMIGVMQNSIAATITASTTQTQGQQALVKDVNEVSTVANANDVVTMPTAPTFSRTVTIINNGANVLQIFPATGDDLGAGVNTSVTLAAGNNVRYTNYNNTNWEAI